MDSADGAIHAAKVDFVDGAIHAADVDSADAAIHASVDAADTVARDFSILRRVFTNVWLVFFSVFSSIRLSVNNHMRHPEGCGGLSNSSRFCLRDGET